MLSFFADKNAVIIFAAADDVAAVVAENWVAEIGRNCTTFLSAVVAEDVIDWSCRMFWTQIWTQKLTWFTSGSYKNPS